ncbi:MAG: type I-E CRISPR-associated protein Cas6/Cse3/CasE, partial [Anaerolineae bacterium]|nr:type I-E CRISPR-associated protein Cas6/Cse3/CasE [Anaerolineae bacterium]
MYLSRLTVNARSQAAWRDLADRYELHRTLLSAFPATLAAAERLLYRVEQRRDSPAAAVLVQSHTLPDWSASARLALPDYLLTPPEIRLVQP